MTRTEKMNFILATLRPAPGNVQWIISRLLEDSDESLDKQIESLNKKGDTK